MQDRAHIEVIAGGLRAVLGQLDELGEFEAAIDLDLCINKLFDRMGRARPQEDIDALLDSRAFEPEPVTPVAAEI